MSDGKPQVKVLIVGFSVTAETPGYVGAAAIDLGDAFDIHKVGIGGIHPHDLKHLFASIVDEYQPDLIVLELSTAGFRQLNLGEVDHEETINIIFGVCGKLRIKVAFLDLPRNDVDYENDWLYTMHKRICQKHGLAIVRIENSNRLLRDFVHPSEEGIKVYSDALQALLVDCSKRTPLIFDTENSLQYDALLVANLVRSQVKVRSFQRSGYNVKCVEILSENLVHFDFEEPVLVCGITFLAGPFSGFIRLNAGDYEKVLNCYDQYCYYERFVIKRFDPFTCSSISLEQLPEIPQIKLLKGDANLHERKGYVVHILTVKKDI